MSDFNEQLQGLSGVAAQDVHDWLASMGLDPDEYRDGIASITAGNGAEWGRRHAPEVEDA